MASYAAIAGYHQATKHHFDRYARSAGRMDWENQPDPFRQFQGAPQVALDPAAADPDLVYDDLFTPVRVDGRRLAMGTLGSFLALWLGLSAWKSFGNSRWSLRMNPSSGNLHPTEGHLIVPDLPDLAGGVYHYRPFVHGLERRAVVPREVWPSIQSHFGGPGFLVALSTIFWRESWKYGERAYRYCCLDIGHALAGLAVAARLFDWQVTCLAGAGDRQIGTLLGFDRTPWRLREREEPESICWVSTALPEKPVPRTLPARLVKPFETLRFEGTPNTLSPDAVAWPAIDRAAVAAEKPVTEPGDRESAAACRIFPVDVHRPAAAIIRQRRSAVSYDWNQSMTADVFWSILGRLQPMAQVVPFAIRLMPPAVHPVIFVHRVDGVAPGLYVLPRHVAAAAALRSALKPDYRWRRVKADFPLYLLEEREFAYEAMELSCHQQIAGQGAFAVSMLAPFDDALRRAPFRYRHLHWECGMIGQLLYLGAEAHGVRATGIGCFFDDPVHELLGIRENAYQCLYHFTVGHPVEDRRLTTLPAYHHLRR